MKIIKSRLFIALIILFCFGFIFGIVYYYLIDSSSINDMFINYISLFNNEFSYVKSLLNSLIYNIGFELLLWSFGFIFIFIFLIPMLIIFKGFSLGISFVSIIYIYNLKGFLYAFILLFPYIINSIIYIFTSYYSFNYGFKCFKIYKSNKSINFKSFTKNYLYILIIFNLLLLISSLIEIYISSNIMKYVV